MQFAVGWLRRGMVFTGLIETMAKSGSESHGTSITIQCSARKSKWARKSKGASFSLFAEFEKLQIPAVTASLRVKLPRAFLNLNLAVRYSVCEGSSSTVRKTVKFFGLLETRKVGLRLRGCFGKLKAKTLHIADSGSGGTICRSDVQLRKLAEPEHADQRKSHQDVSLGNWGLPSHFSNEKKRLAAVFQVGVLLLTLVLPSRLAIARAIRSAAFMATTSVIIALVLNFFGVKNKLGTEFRKLWEEAANVEGVTVSPQVMWSIVDNFSRSKTWVRVFFGITTLFIVILFQLSPST